MGGISLLNTDGKILNSNKFSLALDKSITHEKVVPSGPAVANSHLKYSGAAWVAEAVKQLTGFWFRS